MRSGSNSHTDPGTPGRARRRRLVGIVVLVTVALLAAACVPGGNEAARSAGSADGFWWGLWHGMISPFTFVISLFRDDVGIYEIHNSGGWYDAGFMLGISMAFGGAARSGTAPARRRRTS